MLRGLWALLGAVHMSLTPWQKRNREHRTKPAKPEPQMADNEQPRIGGPIPSDARIGRPERLGVGADGMCIYHWVRDEPDNGGDEERE